MKFHCCRCEHKFHYLDLDLDERMCFPCLDEIIEEFGEEDKVNKHNEKRKKALKDNKWF